jgi:predicted nucleotidyltransferase
MFEFTDPIEIHDTLNPNLWDNDHLRKDVHVALLRIAKEFYDFLNVDVRVDDVIVSGSQANYNYTKYSDLDLHLIVPYSQVQCDVGVAELFDTKRKLWKEEHDITVNGVPVELYVEDIEEPAVSSTYSIVKNQWIKQPVQSDVKYNRAEIEDSVTAWERLIKHAIEHKNLSLCLQLKDLLKKYRKLGLKKSGEFGVPNLIFKSLRNDGVVEQLLTAIRQLQDKELGV